MTYSSQKIISITTPEKITISEEIAIDEECEKENMGTIIPERTIQTLVKDLFQPDLPTKNGKLINFCYDILHELENKSYAHPFYKCDINKGIKYPMDLLTINSKLENNQYTLLEEFEDDIRLIFCNCYTYNDVESKVYYLGKELEAVFNKKWNEKLILNDRQSRELKRVRDNDDTDSPFKKQIRILEQNEDKLIYRHVINKTLLVVSAYENLIAGNIMPFIKNLKTFLLTRSKMSLYSADVAVLQAIVKVLLPSKYCIPELSLVMDGNKQKGYGRFGYSDIFVLKGTGDNNISLELKYISLVSLIKNQKNNFSTKDLEDLDKTLEKEDEESLLKRLYTYWSKEYKETKQITIGEVLNNGINQLESYMNIISNGKPINYTSSVNV
ncbi:bromodomain-containing protein [Rhizophagus clarus]|uniref:Bromodomain-containing protein n=1 Tax=Rhizophagus clarus TaxID=94130 RepID=A0A8H3LIE3_9GLOM|nr:bromodomain-containing protein [Rhizophagus clarus]